MREGGGWSCLWQGYHWTGSWRLDGDTLHVSEWRLPDPGWPGDQGSRVPLEWSVKLRRGLEGEIDNGWGKFRLTAGASTRKE